MKPSSKIADIQNQLDRERKLVSFDSYDLSVRQLLDMIEAGEIFVPPEYQRQFIWDPQRQSVLIESIFLGIPIPSLFMATNPDSTWEVVDGVQRLGTLSHFVASEALLKRISKDDRLTISGLEKLESFNGFDFATLPKSIQLHFLTRPVRVTVLNDKSDLSVRFDLFERLNTGGILLTQQEIRNCVYRGKFNSDLKPLSAYPAFRSAVRLKKEDASNSLYEEMALRFFAYLDSYRDFDHSVKSFLNDYMKGHQNSAIPADQVQLFKQVMDLIAAAFPSGISRGRAVTPVNLYEAISVGTALALRNGADVAPEQISPLAQNEQLKTYTGAGSNQKKYVIGRIELVRDLLS
jgi:hypothetical protein